MPGSCAGEAPQAIPAGAPIALPPLSDAVAARCAITPAVLQRAMAGWRPLLIDLRREPDYAKTHIPGALNIPAALLPHKRFARNRHVVLVDAGRSEQQVLRACEQLINKGFHRVHALQGGMAAWISDGYETTGTAAFSAELLALSPRDIAVGLAEHTWTLVLDPGQTAALPQDLASLPHVVLTDELAELAGRIGARNDNGVTMPGVLFLSTRADTKLLALGLARQLPGVRVRYATDGLAGILAYRNQRTAMLARPAGGVLAAKRCDG